MATPEPSFFSQASHILAEIRVPSEMSMVGLTKPGLITLTLMFSPVMKSSCFKDWAYASRANLLDM